MIAERWNARLADSASLVHLREVSRILKDVRIANALMNLLEDQQTDMAIRRAALEAMASQLAPTLRLQLGHFVDMPVYYMSPPHALKGSVRAISGSIITRQERYHYGRDSMTVAMRLDVERRLGQLADRQADSEWGALIRGAVEVADSFRRSAGVGGKRDLSCGIGWGQGVACYCYVIVVHSRTA